MAAHHDIADLLENIRKELPERLHGAYEDAVNRATEQGRKRGRHVARQMLKHNPWLREERQRQQQQEGALAFFALIIGFIGGAALMYLFDPERGEQRRATLRQQANQAASDFSKSVEESSQHAQNEVNRVVSQKAEQVPDTVKQMAQRQQEIASATALKTRVRIEIARSVRAPGAIEIDVNNGAVTLTGKVLASEVQSLVEKVQALPGVRSVENRLEVHDAPESPTTPPNNLNAAPQNGA